MILHSKWISGSAPVCSHWSRVHLQKYCNCKDFINLLHYYNMSHSQSHVEPNKVNVAMNGVETRLFTRFIKDCLEVVKWRVLISGRLSTWPIFPQISHIRNTLVDIMKFYLPHQLMQHKSIFVQPGRATYITVMTTPSQGGTTNETKCNYCPACLWENKIKATWLFPFGGFKERDGALLSLVITQRFNWLSCHSAHYDSH